MLSATSELVWEGRQHLGDEPGVYGDAGYSGIALEFPLTLQKTDPAGPDTTTLRLHARDVQTFAGYPGHLVTVTAFQPIDGNATHAAETVLTTQRLINADPDRRELDLDLDLDLTEIASPAFVSVRVRVDTEVPPGLYDDFLVTKVVNRSEGFVFVATFGFSA